jgi:hypothetical protein
MSMALMAPFANEIDAAWFTEKRLDDRPPERAE